MDLQKINITHEFGKRIQYLRKLRNWSQEELSFRCGVNKNYLSDLERGTRNPTLLIIQKISEGFGITIEELFKGLGTYNV